MGVLISKIYKKKKYFYIAENYKTALGKYKRRQIKSLGCITITEAKRELAKFHSNSNFISNYKLTVNELFNIYKESLKDRVSEKTYKMNIKIMKDFDHSFIVLFGSKPFYTLNNGHIETFHHFLKNKKLKSTTISLYFTITKTFLRWCRNHEYTNKTFIFPKILHKNNPIVTLSNNDMSKLIDNSGEIFGFYIQFMCLTGLRPKEFIKLKWSDIRNREINVISDNPLKSGRNIPVSSQLARVLRNCKFRRHSKYVCHIRKASNLSQTISNIGKDVLNKKINLYTFRKYFATKLADNGLSPIKMCRLMGHSSINTALKYYISDDLSLSKDLDQSFQFLKLRSS